MKGELYTHCGMRLSVIVHVEYIEFRGKSTVKCGNTVHFASRNSDFQPDYSHSGKKRVSTVLMKSITV